MNEQAPGHLRVTVSGGILEGTFEPGSGVRSFKGIPFAAPPVGDLRWRSPQPVQARSGVPDAGAYGHDCMQVPIPSDAAPLGTTPEEDSLVLSVWRPAKAAGQLPVRVWLSTPDPHLGNLTLLSCSARLGSFLFQTLHRCKIEVQPLCAAPKLNCSVRPV